MVETYPVDIAPEQVVRWLMVEGRLHAFDLLVSATRSFEAGELAGDERLGDEEREEVSEISDVGLLEVMPGRSPIFGRSGFASRTTSDPVCLKMSRFQKRKKSLICRPSMKSSSRPTGALPK